MSHCKVCNARLIQHEGNVLQAAKAAAAAYKQARDLGALSITLRRLSAAVDAWQAEAFHPTATPTAPIRRCRKRRAQ